MFNDATFREFFLRSLGKLSDYVAQIYIKYAEKIELADLGEKLCNATN